VSYTPYLAIQRPEVRKRLRWWTGGRFNGLPVFPPVGLPARKILKTIIRGRRCIRIRSRLLHCAASEREIPRYASSLHAEAFSRAAAQYVQET